MAKNNLSVLVKKANANKSHIDMEAEQIVVNINQNTRITFVSTIKDNTVVRIENEKLAVTMPIKDLLQSVANYVEI